MNQIAPLVQSLLGVYGYDAADFDLAERHEPAPPTTLQPAVQPVGVLHVQRRSTGVQRFYLLDDAGRWARDVVADLGSRHFGCRRRKQRALAATLTHAAEAA